jgi:uncharacterized protein
MPVAPCFFSAQENDGERRCYKRGCPISVASIETTIQPRKGNSMASNIEMTKKGYEHFQRGDIPGLIRDLVDDTCTWISPGPKEKLPWAGTFRGKQEIANFFAQVGQNLEFTEFAPHEMIEQGNTVVVLGRLAGTAKKTGKPIANEWAHVFKYREGKVVFFQEYIDTAADVVAMS